jgi:hypothetical protein
MRTFREIFFIGALLLISACGKSAPSITTIQPSTQSTLIGTWRMDGVAGEANQNSETPAPPTSQDNLFEFNSDGTYQTLAYQYDGSNTCDPSLASERDEYYGTLSSDGKAMQNIVLKQIRRAPLSPATLQSFNDQKNCGHGDWKLDQSQDCNVADEVRPGHLRVTYTVSGDSLTLTSCSDPTPRLTKCVTSHYQRVTE